MVIHIEFNSGKHKYIPLAESVEVKEMHVVIFTETGTELELRSNIRRLSIVGL